MMMFVEYFMAFFVYAVAEQLSSMGRL